MIATLDGWILRRVTAIAYLVQTGTGLTSYRLAQAAVVLWVGIRLIEVFDYFSPVAGLGPNKMNWGDLLIYPFWALIAQHGWFWCRKAQAAWASGTQAVPAKGPLVDWPFWYRAFEVGMCALDTWFQAMVMVRGDGPTLLQWLRYSFDLIWTLYLYLLDVYPRPLGWLRQLQPIRTT